MAARNGQHAAVVHLRVSAAPSPAAEAGAVAAAGGVDAVVRSDDANVPAVHVHVLSLQALVALGDVDGAAVDRQVLVGVHGVVAGLDGEGPAAHGHVDGVQAVVGAVKGIGAVQDI